MISMRERDALVEMETAFYIAKICFADQILPNTIKSEKRCITVMTSKLITHTNTPQKKWCGDEHVNISINRKDIFYSRDCVEDL